MQTKPLVNEVLQALQALANPDLKAGLVRFGINNQHALGIKIPVLQAYAKSLKKNQALALALWEINLHKARLLAIFLAVPAQFTEALMEQWIRRFDSWDICDQACARIFVRVPWAFSKAQEWAVRTPEFEKRAGFVLMATLAIHDKKATNEAFMPFFPLMQQEANDERNFVKKAINWALRQVGKRNLTLNQAAVQLAQQLKQQPAKSAQWIATDALRELTNPTLLNKLTAKEAQLKTAAL
ncbi:DNA alkylation repair protein [Adhaeribacter rhizoryzae]|uniref:DNA alkylation repair protein n=1 Tax=Adhaeribacter rhizoryzae TaxID=2607907 RepID=A0A5M6D7K8_9BACT|nr:DNA alkylation repair protein [Adhaeribacter rhizoryzae]KAA5543538.1 DNA alkylation repair protein [Adhaeribacter rhizoryzae]